MASAAWLGDDPGCVAAASRRGWQGLLRLGVRREVPVMERWWPTANCSTLSKGRPRPRERPRLNRKKNSFR
jgi:hypothetical protein